MITISKIATRYSEDPTWVFRVDATVVSTRRGCSPTRNLSYVGAVSYAQHLEALDRYSDIRVDVDTF